MGSGLLTGQFGCVAIETFAQFLPINGRDFEVVKGNAVKGFAQSLDSRLGIGTPTFAGGRNPYQVGKLCVSPSLGGGQGEAKRAACIGQETIHRTL